MITNSQRHLLIFALAFIFLLLLPIVNCTNDQIEERSIDKQFRTTSTIKNHLYDLSKQEKLNSNNYEEEIKYLIENFFKTYPHRRASQFHAMRGRRFIQTN